MENNNIVFNLSRGNPNNDPCGIGLDGQVFGKSLGGQFFDKEEVGNRQIIKHNLRNGTNDVFDPIVPSDVIKSTINYRCVYISNKSQSQYVTLDKVSVSDVDPDPLTESLSDDGQPFTISDISIAIEDVYTINELKRPIPNSFGKPGNPSIYINDEYDSRNRLRNLLFLKEFSGNQLPIEIPPNSALKVWVRRTMTIGKDELPEDELEENFTITVDESNGKSTSLEINYTKNKGRIPLSNWYDYTITPGNSSPIVMRELLPKEVDVSLLNVIKTFYINEKVVILYSMSVLNSLKYFMLFVEANDIPENNKYVQVELLFQESIQEDQELIEKTLNSTFNSYYDPNIFYFFWNETISITDPCVVQFFGFFDRFERISTDLLYTHIWTDDEIFKSVTPGYENRRFDSYQLIDFKVIRDKKRILNIEQFDDLFIFFMKDTKNLALTTLPNINVTENELLYIFEKDIQDSEKYSSLNHYPGENSEVMSSRLFPISLPTVSESTSFNNAFKNSKVIISSSSSINKNTDFGREIKTLLDGTRYVDFNSFHTKAFDVGDRFITYQYPFEEDTNRISITTSISINSDDKIVEKYKDGFSTTSKMENTLNGIIYERPHFQQNIIDENRAASESIPLEWADREYKDEWKTILSTLPIETFQGTTITYSLQYNFNCNSWRSIYLNKNNDIVIDNHNKFDTSSTGTTGTTGTPVCKEYTDLNIQDLDWVIEPNTFQPITIELSANLIPSDNIRQNRYFVNIKVMFKGNEEPLANIQTYTTNLSNLSYVLINPSSDFNYKINYLDLNKNDILSCSPVRTMNLHSSILNKLSYRLGPEFTVNPQLFSEQAEFPFYRIIEVGGFENINEGVMDINYPLPIILYGNGYKDSAETLSRFFGSENTFDFSKLSINDNSLRIYSDNSNNKPLSFKVGMYDYEKDYVVLWVKINNIPKDTLKLKMYYGKSSKSEDTESVTRTYNYLKRTIYPNETLGAWHFEKIKEDERISFVDGNVFNSGEPVIFEKTRDNELRLTQIDKEYMYGIASIFKSHKFNLDIDIKNLEEQDLYYDFDKRVEFENFVRKSVDVFKPSYTDLIDIKPFGIDILEAGGGSMGLTNNKKSGGIISISPNSNVNTFYDRTQTNRYNLLTSFNGFSQNIDWVIAKELDTSLFKSGVLKVSGNIKSDIIRFETPFKDNNYFVFLASPINQKIYWNILCPDRFGVTASHFLTKEVSWMAVHQDVFGGVFTPDSMYVGRRVLDDRVFIDEDGNSYTEWPGESNQNVNFPPPTQENLSYWYNNEIIIKPEIGVEGEDTDMNIDPTDPGYSVILSSNENINTYWVEKMSDRFRVRTSSPSPAIIHYLVIRNGIEWWEELI